MTNTRGGLVAAKICQVGGSGVRLNGGLTVECMFNPFEYTISKSNTFREKQKNQADNPRGELFSAGAQTLRLSLIFDTYESGEDVSWITDQLWKFMLTKDQEQVRQYEKVNPPQVAFEWGVFFFVSYITSMTQRFTLFKQDGTPVRAKVDVTFTQYTDVKDFHRQNPTSGSEISERIHRVTAGDRLDKIAWDVYRDATKWRVIATHNNIINPLSLRPGQQLRIPLE
jgi:nucleoid-associated protein YgaU